jgi:hypothetical protein
VTWTHDDADECHVLVKNEFHILAHEPITYCYWVERRARVPVVVIPIPFVGGHCHDAAAAVLVVTTTTSCEVVKWP